MDCAIFWEPLFAALGAEKERGRWCRCEPVSATGYGDDLSVVEGHLGKPVNMERKEGQTSICKTYLSGADACPYS